MSNMRDNFHLVLSVASLGLFFGAVVLAPRFGRSSAHGGSLDVLRVSPYQRRQQLLRTVESMYGSERGTQRRQQLLSTTSEVDRAMGDSKAGYIDSSQRLGRVKAIGVRQHSLDEGLPTLTSDTVWSKGSPQNQGWSGGDFEAGAADNTGTGKVKGTQYAWWQRHLVPDQDFQKTMMHLQATEPHYDAHGNEFDPGEREGENSPVSYRGPGFDRMSP
mmetsp:Transcript_54460/g.79893  ORF Transcript_54460/g.79893 Transcript_54460/m.79893 type:complete len:217 (+) Transcript_54460:48-698(+)